MHGKGKLYKRQYFLCSDKGNINFSFVKISFKVALLDICILFLKLIKYTFIRNSQIEGNCS